MMDLAARVEKLEGMRAENSPPDLEGTKRRLAARQELTPVDLAAIRAAGSVVIGTDDGGAALAAYADDAGGVTIAPLLADDLNL